MAWETQVNVRSYLETPMPRTVSITHSVNGTAMRENRLGVAILLSIVTLGIYWLILVYRNTVDIHRAAGKDILLPVVLFVAGFFFPLIWLGLFSLNGLVLNELRIEKGLGNDPLWIVALVLHLFAFVGSIVWAVHYDGTLQRLEQAA